MKPLGMVRSRGAIVTGDRMLYAQGYEPDRSIPRHSALPNA